MTTPAFKLTKKQARDLCEITPPGYAAKITIAFERSEALASDPKSRGEECDGVFGEKVSD